MQCSSWLSLTLLVYTIALIYTQVDARYLKQLPQYRSTHKKNNLPDAEINSTNDKKEPSLFQLLVNALGKSERQDTEIAGQDGEKRGSFKQAKPCYWSLVSCYKKKK